MVLESRGPPVPHVGHFWETRTLNWDLNSCSPESIPDPFTKLPLHTNPDHINFATSAAKGTTSLKEYRFKPQTFPSLINVQNTRRSFLNNRPISVENKWKEKRKIKRSLYVAHDLLRQKIEEFWPLCLRWMRVKLLNVEDRGRKMSLKGWIV